jgi:hypothetical protein
MSKVNNYLITFGDVATMGFTSKASYPGGYNANKIMTKGEIDTYWFVDTTVAAYAGYTSLRCPRYQDLQNTTTTSTTTTTTTTTLAPCQVSLSPSNIDGATACNNWNNVIDRTAYYALYYPCSAANGQQLYTDSGLTTLIPNGWYSDGTTYFQVVGGNGTLTNSTACPGTTSTTSTTTSTTTTTTSTTTTTTTTEPPPTTEPPTTSTTTTTTTTTTTAAPVAYTIDSTSTGTAYDACTTGNPTIPLYAAPGNTVPYVTMILYTNTGLSTPYIGGTGWRKLTQGATEYAAVVTTDGEITDYTACAGLTTSTTTSTTTTTTTTTTLSPNVDIYINTVSSLDIPITGMTINGVAVTWSGGGPDFTLTAGDNGSFTSTETGTQDVVISYGSNTAGQRIIFTDSNSVATCHSTSPSGGTFTITGATITLGTTISVYAEDGACP